MRGDNIESVPSWVYRVDYPLSVDAEPWPNEHTLERDTSRDTVLLCIAGMVIIAILAYWLGSRG